MKDSLFIISYCGVPLVSITNHEFWLPSELLTWYAEHYAFDRKKLSWAVVDEVVAPSYDEYIKTLEK